MADILIPELGEGIEGGEVLEIHVAVGDTVTEGQALLELETGKATVDVPAPSGGTIESITVSEGDQVVVGSLIATFGGNGTAPVAAPAPAAAPAPEPEPAAPPTAPAAPAAPTASKTIDLVIPELGEGIEGGEIISVNVGVGDSVTEGQSLLEMETGKATVDIPAPATGTITIFLPAEGDTLTVGDSLGAMEGASSSSAPAAPPPAAAPAPAAAAPATKIEGSVIQMKPEAPPPAPPPHVERPAHSPIPAAPSVRKFAREIGIELAQVNGTGPRGRISIADVKAHAKALNSRRSSLGGGGAVTGGPGIVAPPLPDFSKFGDTETEKMSGIRKMTMSHMSLCWGTIPHVTQHDHADTTDLEAARQAFKKRAEKAGAKLTITAMLVKILGHSLKAFPNFNASIDAANQTVVYKKYVNVGVAVDTPKGLVVPVIRNVDQKNIIEIAIELGEMAGKMREGKITPDMIQGGCISLSNLGGLNGKLFTPIVNSPEVAILGIGRGSMQPVWDGSAFQPRMMTPLSLSYDHRLIDGADGTRFLRWIVEAMENPLLVSLEG